MPERPPDTHRAAGRHYRGCPVIAWITNLPHEVRPVPACTCPPAEEPR